MRNIEFDIQVQLFKWAELNTHKYKELELLNSSQNGVKLTSIKAGKRAKMAGLKKGFPDIFLPVARCGYHGLFIELKRAENKQLNITAGRLSEYQKRWLEALSKQGYCCYVAYGLGQAIEYILSYLNEK